MALAAALVMAQRQRERARKQHAILVARAHEEERAWVASELHDDVLQRVALVRAEVESLDGSDAPVASALLESRLRGIAAELVDLGVAVRRIAARLHPTVVDQVGLVPALHALAEEIERGSEVEVRINSEGAPTPVPAETARMAYRIVQESLRNVVRHSGGSTARVRLNWADHLLMLRVQDDGRGFDTSVAQKEGLGLASLRERALMVGGSTAVVSRPGAGTLIEVRLPLGAP